MDRIMISGVSSGCGKTTVVCAVLQALVNRGLKTGAFKCGPDYIDPMFHSRIIGAKSANLDLHFFSENTLRFLLAKNAAGCDVSVIEGAMGFYDGAGLTTWKTSAYELALVTKTPVVLVVNARGAALSVLAVIEGFLRFRPESGIRGVILNQCTAMTYASLSAAIEERFGIRCFGFLPRLDECVLESRHLGLVTAGEIRDLREKMQTLAAQAEKTLDIDALLALAHEAEPLDYTPAALPKKEKIRLAVARDNAFCFYYEDSLDAVREMGGELVPFSPITDGALPENIDGLYLGGGYPELYAKELGENASMRASVRAALERGVPCIAECGGFMYLTEAIGDEPRLPAGDMLRYRKAHPLRICDAAREEGQSSLPRGRRDRRARVPPLGLHLPRRRLCRRKADGTALGVRCGLRYALCGLSAFSFLFQPGISLQLL